MRSAQAAQITQSELSLEGSGFLTRVTGNLDCFGFIQRYDLAAVWMEANGEPSILEGTVNQAKAGFSNRRWLCG